MIQKDINDENRVRFSDNFKSAVKKTFGPRLRESKQHKYMHPLAVQNRLTDTKIAIQRGRKTSKEIAGFNTRYKASNAEADARALFMHQKKVSRYIKDREQFREQQKIDKRKDYFALVGKKDPQQKSGNKNYVARSSKTNKYGLKRPKRLYNDPNL